MSIVPVIAGFRTRAQVGLVPPRSRSTNIDPAGSAIHYGGSSVPVSSHSDCEAFWRSWQSMHMRPGGLGTRDGASDIAYNLGPCQHGYVLAGRGAGVRSGANGTTASNGAYYAICGIIGAAQNPTPALLNAYAWCVATLRDAGAGAGLEPHSLWRDTGCPGDKIRARIPDIRRAATTGGTTTMPASGALPHPLRIGRRDATFAVGPGPTLHLLRDAAQAADLYGGEWRSDRTSVDGISLFRYRGQPTVWALVRKGGRGWQAGIANRRTAAAIAGDDWRSSVAVVDRMPV